MENTLSVSEKNKTRISKRTLLLLGLTVLILLQIIFLCLFCSAKAGFSIDEIYSYILSNSHDADRIANADAMWNKWILGEDFSEFVTVQDGEQFSYDTVYRNNSLDCHPPLYYFALHTVCSFFPNQFSSWFGLALNLICFILSDILIFMICNLLITSEKLRLLPVLLFGFSLFAVDAVTFIRMYIMQTVFVLAFLYFCILMIKNGFTVKRIIALGIFIFLGAFTHYYSLVVSFFGVLTLDIYLILKKQIKNVVILSTISLGAVILLIVLYPFVLTQATGSSTNNIGNEISSNLFNFKLWIFMTVSLAKEFLSTFSFHPVLSLAVIGTVTAVSLVCCIHSNKIGNKKSGKQWLSDNKDLLFLSIVFIVSFLGISFIGGEYVYIRYIYMLIPVFYIVLVCVFDRASSSKKGIRLAVSIILVLFTCINSIVISVHGGPSYLYDWTVERDKKILEYSDTPMIVIGSTEKRNTAVPTGNFPVFSKYGNLYLTTLSEAEKSDILQSTLEKNRNVILCIATDAYWCDGLKIEEVLPRLNADDKTTYTELGDGSLVNYYLLYLQ